MILLILFIDKKELLDRSKVIKQFRNEKLQDKQKF